MLLVIQHLQLCRISRIWLLLSQKFVYCWLTLRFFLSSSRITWWSRSTFGFISLLCFFSLTIFFDMAFLQILPLICCISNIGVTTLTQYTKNTLLLLLVTFYYLSTTARESKNFPTRLVEFSSGSNSNGFSTLIQEWDANCNSLLHMRILAQ